MKSDFKKVPRSLTSNVPLAPYTTFRIGGPARFFIEAHSVDDVLEAAAFAHTHSLDLFVLGGGSNILIADDGFSGVVLRIEIKGITHEMKDDHALVTAGAGVSWDELVAWSIEHDFSGFECLSGIPGTVGGAVVANLGAYGVQCSDTFIHAEVLDRQHDNPATLKTLSTDECEFSYHDSLFGRTPGRYVVLRATFALIPHGIPRLTYRDHRFDMAGLATRLGHEPALLDVRTAVLDMREQKGNLIMPGRPSYKGAGSFFHMPFVTREQYADVIAKARSLDEKKEEKLRPWAWPQPDGTVKIAPGFLLEYTEFKKGYVRGPVGISPKHTLVIINRNGATARDVADLARDMQSAVQNTFTIRLEREVEYVGAVEK